MTDLDPTRDLERVAAFGVIDAASGLPAWAAGDLPPVRRAGEAAVRLFSELAQLRAARERIEGDPGLTAVGKAERIATAARGFASVEIPLAQSAQAGLQNEAAKSRAAIKIEPPASLDSAVRELRAIEVRSTLRHLDAGSRAALLLELAGDGQSEALAAALADPLGMVDAETRATVLDRYAELHLSADLTRARRLESAAFQLRGLIENARRETEQMGAPSALFEIAAD